MNMLDIKDFQRKVKSNLFLITITTFAICVLTVVLLLDLSKRYTELKESVEVMQSSIIMHDMELEHISDSLMIMRYEETRE